MDSNMQSPTPDNVETKAAFRKPSNHVANRKYRRRSPADGSSSSEGSPKSERGTSPFSSRGDPAKASERQHRRKDEREYRDSGRSQSGKDSYRHSDRYSSRNSHGYSRHDEYSRHEKRADDEERHYQGSSHSGMESRRAGHSDHTREESERGRSRDYVRNVDKYSRDRYDGSGHRSKDKERDSFSLDRQKFRDKDSSPDRAGSGRKHTLTTSEDKDRDRHRQDRDGWDEKRNYHRSSGDYKSDRRNDSGRDHDVHRYRDSYKDDQKDLNGQKEKKKHDDWDANRDKDRYEQNEDKPVFGSEKQESIAKKPRLFSSERDADYNKDGDEKQSSKQVGVDAKVIGGEAHVNNSEGANDLNAAKVAAMKAAELVNRNLVGVGFMSTEQKKKLLWGNKKSTASEESGHRWDTALFGDRERQEKFNKLMSLRLPWYLWPIVGCKGRCEGRANRQRRWQWSSPGREAEGSPDGFREAVHCWSSTKRWPHCWIGSLSVSVRSFCTLTTILSDILLFSFARIMTLMALCSCNVGENMQFISGRIIVLQNGLFVVSEVVQ
ncbi:hypothetical protein P3X46_004679 [Hevea brasiliensis]|uniref:Small acidic protein-like domain-containing protein n=1 Tax=Hevea brasiliensis TaxID=3981 RepID=A0ABQ9MYE1_HEVBR|nr:uncharacterized protein LOC110653730 isoform X1 [Hevea brasiliensis]KAJ9184998.1 hypothetical protein P3X46_004679 [Hevea brasiliensis]